MSYRTKIAVLASYARAGIANQAMARAREAAGNTAGARLYRANVLILADVARETAREFATR